MSNSLIGKTIRNRYHIIEQIGRGNFGVTFVAEDKQCFNELCVVKQFQPQSSNPASLEVARRLFNTEADILGQLGDHERIPRLLAYFEEDREFFIVQELIQGENLSEEITPISAFSQENILDLLEDVLEILVFVQEYGVIHRDIKPSNLIRRKEDQKIVLIDFGSVKQVSLHSEQKDNYVKPTVIVGTENYIPIEQVMGNPGFYSDIHALGIVAIQALTGKLPRELSINRQNELVWQDCLSDKSQYNPKLLKAIDKAVRYRYQERYQKAQDFLRDIREIKAKTQIIPDYSHSHSHIQSESKKRQFLKSRLFKISLLSLLSLILIRIFFVFFQPNTVTYLSYNNQDYGVKIDYPESWQIKTRDDFLISGIIFIAPLENDRDSFQENISVFVENIAPNTSLTQYTQDSIAEIKRLSDPNVNDSESSAIGNYEARSVIYRGEEQGFSVKRMQLWTVFRGKAYTITYTAEPEHYDRFFPVVKKMISSFDLLDLSDDI